MEKDSGFTLLELSIGLLIMGIAMALALPNFISARDGVALQSAAWQIVQDLRTEQLAAERQQVYHAVWFDLLAPRYRLYNAREGFSALKDVAQPATYFDGYLHLPMPNVGFDDEGNVSESGQIILTDPEGAIQDIFLYLQFGDLRVTSHLDEGTGRGMRG